MPTARALEQFFCPSDDDSARDALRSFSLSALTTTTIHGDEVKFRRASENSVRDLG